MEAQFYKASSSLKEVLRISADCFIKVGKSERKYRRLFLSDVYLYVLSDEKVKVRINIIKITKIIISDNSAQFVILSENKNILIDSLIVRHNMIKEIRSVNPKVDFIYVKEPLLDQFVIGDKEDTREEVQFLNLRRLRTSFLESSDVIVKKTFDQLYSIEEVIIKEDNFSLVVATETGVREEFKKKKKKNKDITSYTVKIYPKELLAKNQQLAQQILNQKNFLQEIMSPYFPTLYKCMLSKTFAYCLTEHYQGQNLEFYIKNQSLNKQNLRLLLGQIITGLGQLHESNIAYGSVNTNGMYITSKGFVMFNDLSRSMKVDPINAGQRESIWGEKDVKSVTMENDWWQLGKLIFQIKEKKQWEEGSSVPDYKEKDLTKLVLALLERDPEKRLGSKGDYYQILAHPFFTKLNKKELATQTCQPLKKFFNINYSLSNKQTKKLDQFLQKQDWSIHNILLKDYEYSRQLQD